MRGLGHSVRLFLSLGLDHIRAELLLHVTTMCESPSAVSQLGRLYYTRSPHTTADMVKASQCSSL